jgi:hypothetical protein
MEQAAKIEAKPRGLVDVVYILSTESKWQDREILFSVRSVERHLKNYRRIFIVGHKPKFFGPEVIEIPYTDIFHNKARNIMAKILRAASDQRITQRFILMNDDYFLLQDTDGPTYPYYYKCTLEESMAKNSHNLDYLSHLQATNNLLRSKNVGTLNFDVHFPILYHKRKFRDVCFEYDWAVQAGYVMKSVYCNTLGIAGTQIKDCKINHSHLYWDKITAGMPCLSVGDRSLNKQFHRFLYDRFPSPSRYEV